jgi:hypothetical protein
MREAFLGFCDDAGQSKLDGDGADRLRAYIGEHFKGQEFVLSVQSRSAYRSLRANAYYWSVVVAAAAKDTGQAEDDIHAAWCEMFLPDENKRVEFYNRMTGETLEVEIDPRRSSKQSGSKFFDFVEECRLWCQTFLNVTTPDPDPEYWRKRAAKEHNEERAMAS